MANISRQPDLLFQLFVDSNAAGTELSHKMFLKTISMGLALGCLRTEIIHPQVVYFGCLESCLEKTPTPQSLSAGEPRASEGTGRELLWGCWELQGRNASLCVF